MSTTPPGHLLFLSHAGADREAAVAFAEKIEASPTAKEHRLRVWIDRRGTGSANGLAPGQSWQRQIEDAIEQASAFAVYVPRAGVSYWVETEMRLAFNECAKRRLSARDLPFIPILPAGRDLSKVPATATLYQAAEIGVAEGDLSGVDAIVRAALRLDWRDTVQLVDEPFVGLSAFDGATAGLFFGRENETQELVDKLRLTNFVMVVSDSGAGKSSLVKAGLVPKFREGVFADRTETVRPDAGQWHVVEMRPGRDPFEGLVEGVSRAARAAGIVFDSAAHGKWIRSRDPAQIRDALREAAPSDARLLLVVDQFEELWTSTTEEPRAAFIAALLALAPSGEVGRRVVGTMRRDYFNLCREHPDLAARLEAAPSGGRFLLRRMANEGLRAAVIRPLALAGAAPEHARDLAEMVVRDITDQPGDLALLQMAVTEAWRRRREFDGSIVRAYEHIGRVEGALATVAEDAFANASNDPSKLSADERPIAEALFMRLVHVGDAQGATRRVVSSDELGDDGWRVAQKLATKECRRLVVVRGAMDPGAPVDAPVRAASASERAREHLSQPAAEPAPSASIDLTGAPTVELSHEQLVTQWSRYQGWLRSSTEDPHRADDKRRLDRLMDRAERWRVGGEHGVDLARGSDLADFMRVIAGRGAWLSKTERRFVQQSENRRRREARRWWVATILSALATAGVIVVFTLLWRKAESRAITAEAQVLWHPLEFQEGEAGKDEIDGLWKLAEAPDAVRAAFLAQMLENENLAERFARAPAAVSHALVGVDERRRQMVMSWIGDELTDAASSVPAQTALAYLAIELDDPRAFESVLAAIEGTTDDRVPRALARGLVAWSAKLSDEQARRAINGLMVAFRRATSVYDRVALVEAVAALLVKLNDEQAGWAVEQLVMAIEDTTDLDQLSAIVKTLRPRWAQVSDAQAARVFEALLAAIKATTLPFAPGERLKALVASLPDLSDEEAVRAVQLLLAAIKGTTNVGVLDGLRDGLAALPAKSDDQTARVVESVLAAIEGTTEHFQYLALVEALAALPGALSDDQAARAADLLLVRINGTRHSYELVALVKALAALSAKMSDDQAALAIGTLLAVTRDPHHLLMSLEVLTALPGILSGEQAARAVELLLVRINGTTDPYGLASLVKALAAVPVSLNDDQATRAVEPLLVAIKKTTRGDELLALVQALEALSTLSDDQAAVGVEPLLTAINRTRSPFELTALVRALAALPAKLSDEQATRAVEPLLAAINTRPHPEQLAAIVKALAALQAKISDDQAAWVVGLLLAAIEGTTHGDYLRALAEALVALPSTLSDDQAVAAVESLLATIKGTANEIQHRVLGEGLAALSAKLGSGRVTEVVMQLLAAIKGTTDTSRIGAVAKGLAVLSAKLSDDKSVLAVEPLLTAIEETTHHYQLLALVLALSELSTKMSNDQAARVVEQLLAAMQVTTADSTLPLVRAFEAFSAKMSNGQAARAVGPLLAEIQRTTDPYGLLAVVEALRTLPGTLSDDQAAQAIEPLLAAIKRTVRPDQLDAFLRTLALLSAKMSDDQAMGRSFVMALSCPHIMASNRGRPLASRDVLSQSFRVRFADAPPEKDGWWALIRWAETRFPDVDFSNPPARSLSTND